MNARSLASHAVVAMIAVALGWFLATGNEHKTRAFADPTSNPVEAFDACLRIDDDVERTLALAEFFASADPQWAPRLRERVNTEDSDLVLDEASELLFASWWAKSDPEAAFANAVDPAWAHRHPWLRAVLREWARQDPVAAVAAVKQLPAAPQRGRLEGARVVLDEWFAREDFEDPTPLLDLLPQLELKPRARAIKQLIAAMVEARGLDETERFVAAVPSDLDSIGIQIKPEMMARMAIELLDHDVERAVDWGNRYGEGRKGVGIRKHLAFYWGLRDGPAAMEWAMNLPESPERATVIKRAWLSFTRKQPEAAHAWLTAEPPSRTLQGIYAAYLTNIAQQDPGRARSLAESATDSDVRERMLVAVGKGWLKADPEKAEAWLVDGSGLSEANIRQIRSWVRQRHRGAEAS